MSISRIFEQVKATRGANAKLAILKKHSEDQLLRDVIKATYEPHWSYHIKKLELVSSDMQCPPFLDENIAWRKFLDVLYKCHNGELRGHNARDAICDTIEEFNPSIQKWPKAVVARHLNISCSVTTFNCVWPKLISTFDCQLSHPFTPKKIEADQYVAVEPKLDGVRCLAFIDKTSARLYTRRGKQITNFDTTVGRELSALVDGPEVFDGEIVSADFSSTISDVRRESGVDPSGVVFNVFDWLPRDQWDNRNPKYTCQEVREYLEDLTLDVHCEHVKLIERWIVRPEDIVDAHLSFVKAGAEGTMIKRLDARYAWKRTWDVMKLKDFYSVDLEIIGFKEGNRTYEGHLGAFIVKHGDVTVDIPRGHMTKDEARYIWENRSQYRGEVIEVKYQEVTSDGSLRFPEFMRFRRDREKS